MNTENTNTIEIIKIGADKRCPPCRTMNIILEQFAKEYPDITITKIDVDNDYETAMKYEIRSIPTLIFLKNGTMVDKKIGVVTNEELKFILKVLS